MERSANIGRMTTGVFFRGVLMAGLLASGSAFAAGSDDLMTAVYAKRMNGYQRERMPNGSFKREYYALSSGGTLPGTTRDQGMDETIFPKIANVLGQGLARHNYILAPDSKSADLLLVVHWGKTIPFTDGNYRDTLSAASQASQVLAAQPSGTDVRDQSVEARVATANFEHYLTELGMGNAIRRQKMQATAEVLGYVGELDPLLEEGRFGIREEVCR
jgi:hypothetical protein